MWYLYLIIPAFIAFMMYAMWHGNKYYFNPRNEKGNKLYHYINTCNSFAAWWHWKERVFEFEKEYPTSDGYIKALNEALIAAADRISRKELLKDKEE